MKRETFTGIGYNFDAQDLCVIEGAGTDSRPHPGTFGFERHVHCGRAQGAHQSDP